MRHVNEVMLPATTAEAEEVPTCDECGEPKGIALAPETWWILERQWVPTGCACDRNEAARLGPTPEQLERREAEEREREEARRRRMVVAAGIPPIFHTASLDNLDLSRLNADQARQLRDAVKVCAQFITGTECPSMVLMGTVGTAKSHLAAACLRGRIMATGCTGLFWNWATRWAEYRRYRVAGQHPEAEGLLHLAATVDVLVLDDVGITALEQSQLERCYEIVEARHSRGLPILTTTNANRSELERTLTPRIVDRLLDAHTALKVTLTGKSWRRTA